MGEEEKGTKKGGKCGIASFKNDDVFQPWDSYFNLGKPIFDP